MNADPGSGPVRKEGQMIEHSLAFETSSSTRDFEDVGTRWAQNQPHSTQ